MNLVADEGVEASIVSALRAAGYSVIYMAEAGPATADPDVLGLAQAIDSLLITADKDFGELVFRQGLTSAGVVLIRLHGLSPSSKAQTVVRAMEQHGKEMVGGFTVISPGVVRIRPRASVSGRGPG